MTKRHKDYAAPACGVGCALVAILFGVAVSTIFAAIVIAAVGYAVVAFWLQHRHRPKPRVTIKH